ncbi:hypothetical protein BOX17_01445 [Halomonas aestuarii]|uniref:Uncharacterized protein n=1 Tax=Halomonas aestuarii TaxID=1897729 RepID=A0A1J0VCI1_9GAMM|nr:hypothetical protein [Halomonas aestuarii]APE29739.1 hypothetical protein BOX17_01445 [Halomonas aestuarii]
MPTPGRDTTIGTLRIRGPASVQDRVSRILQQADWPDAGGDEIVFVRQIHVADSADRIGPAVQDRVRQCLRHGTDPANVMRFANRLEMLAALLADLAEGVAARHWYWRRWSRLVSLPPSQALCSILADHQTLLNGLAESLHARRQLAGVWRALADPDAEQLMRELCWRNGYRLTDRASTPRSGSTPQDLPPRIRDRWQPALATMPPASPRFRLAALLIAQETVPLMLMQSASATLSAVTELLTGEPGLVTSPARHATGRPPPAWNPRPTTETPEFISASAHPRADTEPLRSPPSQASSGDDETVEPTAPSPHEHHPVPPGRPSGGLRPADRDRESGQAGTGTPGESRPSHPLSRIAIRTSNDTDAPSPPAPEFQTEQGGALYLLNFLNRPPLPSIMGDYRDALPSGWLWLYRVAQLLALDERDPLVPFLATQMGLEDARDLDALPPLPERERIEALARQWYGASGLWQASLLRLPARIRFSASHLDMHTALSHARIEVRLAGLDLNPGWLPWLGRVVQFHFEQPTQGGT